MANYTIGIDTGGTFTDAVLLDNHKGSILATAKNITTHGRLEQGISLALQKLLKTAALTPDQIAKIAVSSTLATNAVVEGKGSRVAVIVIGYVKHFKLPVKAIFYINGGHTVQGVEDEPLDIEYLVRLIESLKSEIDAYAVCSAMSIKNPAHELVAEKAIAMIDPKPVFCSHRISPSAGMHERAATAALHASLMPVMEDYVTALEKTLKAEGLDCPMEIITGDARAMSAVKAVTEAGLTVASGPACTANFGARQTHTDQAALVVDIGGTTTDIAMLENGIPTLAEGGCRIGNWHTQIKAVDMITQGIGGDSLVQVSDKGKIEVGPTRAIPLALAEGIASPASWLGPGEECRLVLANKKVLLSAKDALEDLLLQEDALTPAAIKAKCGHGGPALQGSLERLTRTGAVCECGFTPTDALHVLGQLELGDGEKARAGAANLGKILDLTDYAFAKLVLEKTEDLIETAILDFLINRYWQNSPKNLITERYDHPALRIDFTLKLPIIGLGAASRLLLPRVAEKLGTKIIFPDHYEVGNGAGAAYTALGF